MELRYLYVGSTDTEADAAAWLQLPGAKLRWRFRHFGADVAAVQLGPRPFVLVTDHRPVGSVLPIYAVDDLEAVSAELEQAGWRRELGPIGTPEGPASVLRSTGGGAGGGHSAAGGGAGAAGGAEIALLQVDRPDAMEGAYADKDNEHAVRLSQQ